MITLASLPEDYISRAKRLLNLADFNSGSAPIEVGENTCHSPLFNQNILRMMIRSDKLPLTIPPELKWLSDYITKLDEYQKAHGLNNPFVYVTVRQGLVKSETDDLWHVDGFSLRIPHVPEQNYVRVLGWNSTEFLVNNWNIPETFDANKHNIHRYFQQYEAGKIQVGKNAAIYAIDPYCVHRRPKIHDAYKYSWRSFTRVSFIPIEIEDDTCTQNPLFPKKIYGRVDVRERLEDWHP